MLLALSPDVSGSSTCLQSMSPYDQAPKSITVTIPPQNIHSHFCSFHCNMTETDMTKNILVLQYALIRKCEMVIASIVLYWYKL